MVAPQWHSGKIPHGSSVRRSGGGCLHAGSTKSGPGDRPSKLSGLTSGADAPPFTIARNYKQPRHQLTEN